MDNNNKPYKHLDIKELKRRGRELADKPIKQLSRSDWGLLIAYYLVIDAEKGCDTLSLREYSLYTPDITPKQLLNLLKPYLPLIEEYLERQGYIHVSPYTWRRWREAIPYNRVRELADKLSLDRDSAYILYVVWRLLKITDPSKRDWRGYNIAHAYRVREYLEKPYITREDIDSINEILVKYYRHQIRELGLDYERLENRLKQTRKGRAWRPTY